MDFVKDKLEQIVRLHRGHSYRTADIIFGFFPDSGAAKAAASILASSGVSVMLCGSQLMMVVQSIPHGDKFVG
jgi:hypothetical protein